MNKRIENLFEQALDAAVPETWTRLDMDQVKRLCDKFAELIVQECARTIAVQGLVESASDEAVKGSYPYIHQCGKISGFHDCMNLLLKHFGIEK